MVSSRSYPFFKSILEFYHGNQIAKWDQKCRFWMCCFECSWCACLSMTDIHGMQTENHCVAYNRRIIIKTNFTCRFLLFRWHNHIPSSLLYKTHLSWQLNCRSLRCSWSIACRRCSNYIFILHLIHGFNRLGKDNCKTGRETLKFWDLVRLILETLR